MTAGETKGVPRAACREATGVRGAAPRFASGVGLWLCTLLLPGAVQAQALGDWPQHAKDRPKPAVITPGAGTVGATPPSDAIVLFDGRSRCRPPANRRSAATAASS